MSSEWIFSLILSVFSAQCTIFNPTIEIIKVVMKNNRQNVAGSLKKKIPTRTAPTAPIPVHTG